MFIRFRRMFRGRIARRGKIIAFIYVGIAAGVGWCSGRLGVCAIEDPIFGTTRDKRRESV